MVVRIINDFCFSKIYLMENSFWLKAPVILKFAEVQLVSLSFLAVSFQDTVYSSVWFFFGCHLLPLYKFPSLCWDGLIWKIINCWRQQIRTRVGFIFMSIHAECVHLKLCQVLLHFSKEQRFLELNHIPLSQDKLTNNCKNHLILI